MHQGLSPQENRQHENETDRRLVGHATADFFAGLGVEKLTHAVRVSIFKASIKGVIARDSN
jgi:hypothetical protein